MTEDEIQAIDQRWWDGAALVTSSGSASKTLGQQRTNHDQQGALLHR